MRSTATQIRLHVSADGHLGQWLRAIEQRLGPHDHAGRAIATLSGLLDFKRLLKSATLRQRAEPLHGLYPAADQSCDRRQARKDGFAIDLHSAGAALAETAAVLRAVELHIIPQHI